MKMKELRRGSRGRRRRTLWTEIVTCPSASFCLASLTPTPSLSGQGLSCCSICLCPCRGCLCILPPSPLTRACLWYWAHSWPHAALLACHSHRWSHAADGGLRLTTGKPWWLVENGTASNKIRASTTKRTTETENSRAGTAKAREKKTARNRRTHRKSRLRQMAFSFISKFGGGEDC